MDRQPKLVTSSAREYLSAAEQAAQLFFFIVLRAVDADRVAYIAQSALDGANWKDADADFVELIKSRPGKQTTFLRENRQGLLELFVSRFVDNFQKYVVDVIREILRVKPEILINRNQSVPLADLLQHDSVESVLHHLIEQKVTALSYEGFVSIQKWCSERGIEIAAVDAEQAAIVEMIATRNLIVHNRGVVDGRYVGTVPDARFKVGETRHLTVDELYAAISLFESLVLKTDGANAQKFGLTVAEVQVTHFQRGADDQAPPKTAAG